MKSKKIKINDNVEILTGPYKNSKGVVMQVGGISAFVRLTSDGSYEKFRFKDLTVLY